MESQAVESISGQTPIQDDVVLRQTQWCTVREQETEFLVYNRHTDELHLIPPSGILVYRLCDGIRSVGELTDLLAPAFGRRPKDFQNPLETFIRQLLERGILEVCDGA